MDDSDDNLVFVPPKKRSSGTSSLKRLSGGGTLNRVDHIVCVQGQDGAPVPLQVASLYGTLRTPKHLSNLQNSNNSHSSNDVCDNLSEISSKREENGNLRGPFKSLSSLDDDNYCCRSLLAEDMGVSCNSFLHANQENTKLQNPSIASLASFNIDSCGNVSCDLSNLSNEGTMDPTPNSYSSQESSPQIPPKSLNGMKDDLNSSNEMLCEEANDLEVVETNACGMNKTDKEIMDTSLSPNVNMSNASLGSFSVGSIAMTTSQEGGLSEPSSDTCLIRQSNPSTKLTEGSVQFADYGVSDDECINESTALHGETHENDANHHPKVTINEGTYVTMTGTIQRGKKAGQNIDVKLNMSRDELDSFEKSLNQNSTNKIISFSCMSGPHILIWSLLCAPFVFLISLFYAFYMGTLTWYNIFMHYNEDRTIWHKIFISPLLVIFFPFLIVIPTILLAVYSSIAQVSWNYTSWYKEVTDLEKGFYGWLCAFFRVEDCSPYEIVILTELQDGTADFKLSKSGPTKD